MFSFRANKIKDMKTALAALTTKYDNISNNQENLYQTIAQLRDRITALEKKSITVTPTRSVSKDTSVKPAVSAK